MRKVVRLVDVEYTEKAQGYLLMDENEDVRALEQNIENYFDRGYNRDAWRFEENVSIHTRPQTYPLAKFQESGEPIYRIGADGELEEVDPEDLVEAIEEEQQNIVDPNQLDLEM
jgi:hypothetical protein